MRYGIGVTDYVNWDAGAAGDTETRGHGDAVRQDPRQKEAAKPITVSPRLRVPASPRLRVSVSPCPRVSVSASATPPSALACL